MNYLCLVYSEEHEPLSEQELKTLDRASLDYDVELEKSGHLITARALQSVETATTIRVRNTQVSMTDGPFAETKEILTGFVLIDARDLNEALQLASGIPAARYGCVEVRPVLDLEKRVATPLAD